MNGTCRQTSGWAVAAVLYAVLIGPVLAQGGPPPVGSQQTGQPFYGAGADQATEPVPQAEAAPANQLPVLFVTGVEVLRTATEPQIDIVRVTGLAASKGWSFPDLVPTAAGVPSDGVLDLELIATAPEQSEEADGFLPVSAVLVLEPGDPYKGIRVRGAENAVELKSIPGSKSTAPGVNDCHDCIGKKFLVEGAAPAAQAGAVRREDLPKELRVIGSASGVRGERPSANRLSLILGDDNTIVEAFWE